MIIDHVGVNNTIIFKYYFELPVWHSIWRDLFRVHSTVARILQHNDYVLLAS